MLSDAALALAIGCQIKWLYNSARRLRKPVGRSTEAATWWRLVHHLDVGLGASLADAARAADTLLTPGVLPNRVRLRATRDESVAILVDLARFHDGAALALASAQYLAVPRSRGRPRLTSRARTVPHLLPVELAVVLERKALAPPNRLEIALGEIGAADLSPGSARSIVRALCAANIPFVVIGDVAAAFHSAPALGGELDICADLSLRHASTLAKVLNDLGSQPRAVAVRDGFALDASLVRAPSMLALRSGESNLNVYGELPDVGEYQQVEAGSMKVPWEGATVRVLGLEALSRSQFPPPSGSDINRWRQHEVLRAILAMETGTR